MILYADVLFGVNFLMDYLALYVAARVLRLKENRVRKALSALIGAAYCVLKIYVPLPEPLSAVFVSLIMCAVAVWNGRLFTYVKTVVLFYAVSMLFGGVMTFLCDTAYRLRNTAFFSDGLTPGMFFTFVGAVFVLVFAAGRIVSSGIFTKTVRVRVSMGSEQRDFCLLCDSGNLLRDPYSGLPVIVMDARSLDGLLGKEGFHRHPERAGETEALRYKFRYIPVRTAVGTGALPAFYADNITVLGRAGGEKNMDALIAVNPSDEAAYGENDGVVPMAAVYDL